MSQPSTLVRIEVADSCATLTLDSPHNRNALTPQLGDDLLEALDSVSLQDAIRCVVLRSSQPVFCAGADMVEATESGMAAGARRLIALQQAILDCPVPVIAQIAGPVRAGGLGLVAACDLAVAANDATFALTEVRLGLAPAAISATVLTRMTSRSAARAILTGETFDAVAAADAGLITAAVPGDDLEHTVRGLVADIVSGVPQGLRESKQLLTAPILAHLERDGEQLAETSARLFASPTAQAAMAAFLRR